MISPEDQKALDAIAAAQAAGQDPFGDDEPLSVKDDTDEIDEIEEPEGSAEEEVGAAETEDAAAAPEPAAQAGDHEAHPFRERPG